MKFITVMDYSAEPYLTMCKGWFHFVRKYHPEAEIIVYSKSSIHPELIRDDVVYEKLDTDGVPVLLPDEPGKVNKLSIHKEWVKYEDFIFMDADAYPLQNLSTLYESCKKPVTFSGHEPGMGRGPEQINSGVFVQKSPLFSFSDLMSAYDSNGRRLKYSGSDQALIQMYFEQIGYSWSDPTVMGLEYNSVADAEISISDGTIRAVSKLTNLNIKIIHGYGEYRFWLKSPELWEYIKNTINKRG